MEAVVLKPFRVRSTGKEYLPGDSVNAEPKKLLQWSEKGLVRLIPAQTPSQDASPCPDQVSGQITIPEEATTETETALADFDTLTERIGLRFDGPEVSGESVLSHPEDGRPLTYTSDPPFVRVYAWVLMQVSHVIPVLIDPWKVAKDCRLTASEVRESLSQLVREGDLVRTVERKRELFRLQIKYS